MKKLSWSHTALKDFEGCKRRYHAVRVLKLFPFEETEASLFGNRLHEAAELYVREDKPLAPEFQFMREMLDRLKAKRGRKLAEYEMALTEELRPCEWKSRDAWVRGIADLLVLDDENLTAWVVDYKSGSNKYPDRDQLVLMSLLVMAHFPHIRRVNSALLFVLKNDMHKHVMERDQYEDGWWKYRERVARIEAAHTNGVWTPTQSGLCKKYCPVLSCEFNGKH